MSHPAGELLASARTVLLVDWPNADVPATLARAGLRVFVRGGPRPDQYTEHAVAGGEIVVRQVRRAPDHADLVYSYRPIHELPEVVALAQAVGARAIWLGATDDEQARGIVQSAGLHYVSGLDIVDQVRRVRHLHEPGTPS